MMCLIVWEDMIPGKEASSTSSDLPSPVARYNATLAAKASPIPKGGNYVKGPGSTTQGYTYTLGTSPLKPITSIPHPPHPRGEQQPAAVEQEPRLPATPDEIVTTDSQIPDLTIGAGWNSAKKRAMAKKRREVMVRALKGRTSDESSSSSGEEEEEIVPHEQGAGNGTSHESIEAFESADVRRTRDVEGRARGNSDGFESDGIAWGQVDADAIEATASQQAARTPRAVRTTRDNSNAPPYVGEGRTSPPATRTTFIDRLKAVNVDPGEGSTIKKRKRDHLEEAVTGNPTSDISGMDGTSTPSYVSACGTLTPPETDRRHLASSSTTDHQASSTTLSGTHGTFSVTPAGGGNNFIHPLVEALNKDLVRRDRKAAADEKSREMLRGRVKALEGRVRELEAELRRVRSERR